MDRLMLLAVFFLCVFQCKTASIQGVIESKNSVEGSKVGEPIDYDDDAVNAPPFMPLDADNKKRDHKLNEAITEDDLKTDEIAVGDPLVNEENSNWLPKTETIAEETAIINERNHVNKVIDGDILPAPGQTKRNAITNKQSLWPEGNVPYFIDVSINNQGRAAIRAAIQEIESNTCISFSQLSTPTSRQFIKIFSGGGCYSYVGRINKVGQEVSIGQGCEYKGIVIHEFMHALGFFHEQSRFDRDKFVRINWQNILAGRESNFEMKSQAIANGLGLPYDYDGIMHYGKTAFSRNGQPTIVRLNNPNGPLGQRNGLSKIDAQQLNILYGCKNVKPPVKPPVQPDPLNALTCDFESNWCGWKQETGDNFNWKRRRGRTPSRRTGPDFSATGRNGIYAFIETSYPRKRGDVAKLISPVVTTNREACMRFKTMMFGGGIGELRVTNLRASSSSQRVLFSQSGNQKKKWQTVNINLPVGKPFQMEISGVRGKDYRGDIAIDQIRVLKGACGKPSTASPPTGSPGSSNGINSKICGTRSTQLQHPLLDPQPQHIVGGNNAKPGDWPWQVGIISRRTSRFIFCGGTLISNEWVISAAHCFSRSSPNNPSEFVILGEHSKANNEGTEETIQLSKIIIHQNYNRATQDNDIALLKLSRPVTFTNYIRPACVADASYLLNIGKNVFVSGWGTTSQGGSLSPVLKVASVPIVSDATCKTTYGTNSITPSMICAGYSRGGTDSCQGDSGGPLVDKNSMNEKYYLVGVVSWGIGCAQANRYGVYARITQLRSWLDRNLA